MTCLAERPIKYSVVVENSDTIIVIRLSKDGAKTLLKYVNYLERDVDLYKSSLKEIQLLESKINLMSESNVNLGNQIAELKQIIESQKGILDSEKEKYIIEKRKEKKRTFWTGVGSGATIILVLCLLI